MKSIICLLLLFYCFVGYAQSQKAAKAATEKLETVCAELDADIQELQDELNQLQNDIRLSRSVSPFKSDENLERILAQYNNIKRIFEDSELMAKIRLHQRINNSLVAKAYLILFAMNNSFQEIYNQQVNDELIAQTEVVLANVILSHKNAAESITTIAGDFRFSVFELARIIDVINKLNEDIKGNNSDKYTQILHELENGKNNELEYIKNYPSEMRAIKDYIKAVVSGNTDEKEHIINKWKNVCNDAFNK